MTVAFELACPICQSAVEVEAESGLCQQNGHRFRRAAGIWRFLPLAREIKFREFLRDYNIVRQAEGWGSPDAIYYRALPAVNAHDPQRDVWHLRAKNFRRLLRWIGNERRLSILDVGAGNGWLSHQLSRRGHTLAALDLSDDSRDGLGACKHYETRIECYQAEFDRLPFRDAQFDVVIFNGALHYSNGLAPTLSEARRVLRLGGKIFVTDSPLYADAASGAAMVAAREAVFKQKFGFTRQPETVGFLTRDDLERAVAAAGLAAHITKDVERWDTRLRRAWIQWRTRREPARFPLIILDVDHRG